MKYWLYEFENRNVIDKIKIKIQKDNLFISEEILDKIKESVNKYSKNFYVN